MALTRAASLRITQSGSTSDASTTGTGYTMTIANSYSKDYTEGTSTDQCDKIYDTNGSLSASATLDIDLSGSIADRIGNTVVFVKVKRIVIRNLTSTTGINLQVGAGSNPLSSIWAAAGDALKIGPNGIFVWDSPVDAFAVTAGTADILRLTNLSGSTSVDYAIWIYGTSA